MRSCSGRRNPLNTRAYIPFNTPRTWLGRAVIVIAGFSLLVVAAVFATVLLAVGLVIAAVVAARILWLLHKAKKQRQEEEFLQAEYHVDRPSQEAPGRIIEGSAKREE